MTEDSFKDCSLNTGEKKALPRYTPQVLHLY